MIKLLANRLTAVLIALASLTFSYAETVSVNLTREGSLAEKVLEQASALSTVTDLTVTGTINQTDWDCIVIQMTSLVNLDMSGAKTSFSTMFTANPNVQTFKMPEGIVNISWSSGNNFQLTDITISNSVTTIGERSFNDLNHLKNIIFGENVKYIGHWACEHSSIQSVTFKSKNIEFDSGVFNNCSNLSSVYVDDLETWFSMNYASEGSNPFCETRNGHLYVNGEILTELQIPEGISSLKDYSCLNLTMTSLVIPEGVTSIGDYTFGGCSMLASIKLPQSLTEIGNGSFSGCTSIVNITLPSNLRMIGSGAFSNCTSLSEISFPESLLSIGSFAFYGCSSLTKVTCLSPIPIAGSYGIFEEINKETCTLIVPEWNAMLYKMAIGWSEFSNIQTVATGDLASMTISDTRYLPASVRPNGIPDVNITSTGSLTVRGENAFNMGNVSLEMAIDKASERYDYDLGQYVYISALSGATLINDESNLTAKSASLDIKSIGGTWGFVTLPFDVAIADIEANGQNYIWKKYDGARRALVGTGGNWVEVTDTLKAGLGYIYQSQDTAIVTLKPTTESVSKVLTKADISTTLQTNAATDSEDAGWNFVGNPYAAYFDTHYIDFTAPITIWNGNGYDAVSLTDDDYVLRPFEAFFVQKQLDSETLTFFAAGRKAEKDGIISPYAKAFGNESSRHIYNVYLSSENYTDKYRVVLNEKASISYNAATDAAKFFSDNNVPQIYSLDTKGTEYAIDERPVGNGIVKLGVNLYEQGTYTIHTDSKESIFLTDKEANKKVDLSEGDYTFSAGAMINSTRFELSFDASTTGVESIASTNEKGTTIYAIDGKQMTNTNNLKSGVYVIKSGKNVKKVVVR